MEIDELLWLSLIPGIGNKKCLELKSATFKYGIMNATEKELERCLKLTKKDRENILLYSRNKDSYFKTVMEMEQRGIRFISQNSLEYPGELMRCIEPPLGLFVKGKLPQERRKTVAIVGSRNCSPYGKRYAREIAMELAQNGVQIVSGMARGIDGLAQEAVLSCGGMTFAVLAGGADVIYPPEHKYLYQRIVGSGGVISEYPPGTEPQKGMFPRRNRIISGLSEAVIIIEAREQSGSFITADYALDQGKDIYVLPGRIDDPLSAGCNKYIKQGAQIISSIEELVDELGLKNSTKSKSEKVDKLSLEKEEALVYSCLRLTPKRVDEIINETKLDLFKVIEIISKLEELGMIEECYKNQFVRST